MLEFKVTVDGLNKVIGDLRKIPAAVRRGLYQGANEAAEFVADELRAFIDREGDGAWHAHAQMTVMIHGKHKMLNLTGGLIGSIEVVPNGLSPSVVIGAPYAVYHEMGTSKMPARPSLGPVAVKTRPQCVEIVKQAVLSSIGGLGFSSAQRGQIKSLLTLASQGKGFFGKVASKPFIHGKVLGMRTKFRIEHQPSGNITGKYGKKTWPSDVQWLFD